MEECPDVEPLQCLSPSPPNLPDPRPWEEHLVKESLKMSNGETSDRGALEALLFQRVGV